MKASKWMCNVVFALAAVLFLPLGLMANNIRIIGIPTVVKNENDKKTAYINFDLAWDNSWRSSKPANWDAAWIFVKCWDGDQWNHVYLKDTNGHVAGNPKDDRYLVRNRPMYGDKRVKKCPMKIEQGKSRIYRKWHVDPAEKADTGVVGVFLYRKDSLGSGNIVVPGISLIWDYTSQGFVYDDDLVVKVFAVEMVYVPEGAFWLGGKGISGRNNCSFTSRNQEFGYPYRVRNEDPILCKISTVDTELCVTCGEYDNGANSYIPADYPKGYQAFYIMKYELTQQAYCDFLNTLNQGQQNGNCLTNGPGIERLVVNSWLGHIDGNGVANLDDNTAFRNFIKVKRRSPGYVFGCDANANNVCDEVTKVKRLIDGIEDSCELNIDGQDLCMNCVTIGELTSYADFAGLRPMTDLEYEKACRGDQPVRENEFAWGSENSSLWMQPFHGDYFYGGNHNSTLKNYARTYGFGWRGIDSGTEKAPAGYNYGMSIGWHSDGGWWWKWHYPGAIRVGIFADSTTSRAESGATYWGVMNMSDAAMEYVICSVKAAEGRKFQGVHGDGQLRSNGRTDEDRWGNIETRYYFGLKGIRFDHRTSWCWGFNGIGDGDEARYDKWGGTVSSRNHWVASWWSSTDWAHRQNLRHYYGIGIRCVRTANAKN